MLLLSYRFHFNVVTCHRALTVTSSSIWLKERRLTLPAHQSRARCPLVSHDSTSCGRTYRRSSTRRYQHCHTVDQRCNHLFILRRKQLYLWSRKAHGSFCQSSTEYHLGSLSLRPRSQFVGKTVDPHFCAEWTCSANRILEMA